MGLFSPARAQWLPTSGPPLGSVKKLLLHDGAVYAGTEPAGVYKTSDSGKTWQALPMAPRVSPFGVTGSAVMSLAGMGRYLYAGTMDSLQRSSDGGKTWERNNRGFGTNWVSLLGAGQGTVYAGSFGELWRSLDSGSTWSKLTLPDSASDLEGIAVIDSIVYLGRERNGIHRSADRGETWTRLEVPNAYGILSIHKSQGILWAGEEEGRVYRSKDEGATWIGASACGGDEVMSLAGTATALYAACERGLLLSTDTGKTWNNVADDRLYVLDREYAAVLADGNQIYAGGDGGVNRITAGAAGTRPPQFNFGLGRQWITAVGSSGTRFYAGYAMRGYHGRTRGAYWKRLQSYAYTTPSAYLPFAGRVLAAAIGRDVGAGIKAIDDVEDLPYAEPADSGLRQTNVYALARIGNVLFAGSQRGVYRSTDTAKVWSPVLTGMDSIPAQVLVAGGTRLFAGSHGKGLFRSADQGGSWTAIGASLKNPVVALAFANNVLVASADSGREVWRSADLGATWTRAQTGIAAAWVRALASSETRLLAGTSQGLYRSLDGALSWQVYNDGIFPLGEGAAAANDFNFTSLAVGNQYVVAGTARGTVWQRTLSDFNLSASAGSRPLRAPGARRYFDASRGGMVFETAPDRVKRKSVTAQGRRFPPSR
jgi:photosystem II stability/assembly factor-like uncharacterized protein